MLKKKVWFYLRYVIFALMTVSISVGVVSCGADPITGYVSPVDDDIPDSDDPAGNGGENQ